MKTDCTIRNWQLHDIELPKGKNNRKIFKQHFPKVMMKKKGPLVFTGTVVKDGRKRWQPGYHMRSSYIISIDRKKGIIVTQNTTYKVIKEGNDIVPAMGNDVLNLFY